jgi:peptidoglycan/xylan/chitin deacetylase (PgdA/CDA1 family)
MQHSIPILLYHRLDDSALSTATPPTEFRRHLQWLSDRGWRSLSRDEFSFFLRSGKALPSRSFMITFDDGYETNASIAFDLLAEFGYTAISFISTQLLRGNANEPRSAGEDEVSRAYLSWDQARALQSSGIIDCQSHTHTHREFKHCTLDEIAVDLDTSLDVLSHELALPRSHFTHLAWPWGLSTPAWRSMAKKAGFNYQYTVARQSFHQHSPLDEIPRTCFDAAAFPQFQRQFWLQSGQLSSMWEIAYPFGRKLRQLSNLFG